MECGPESSACVICILEAYQKAAEAAQDALWDIIAPVETYEGMEALVAIYGEPRRLGLPVRRYQRR